MQYLAAQYLGSLILAMLIGALIGYLWRRLVATGGHTKDDYEALGKRLDKCKLENEDLSMQLKKGEKRVGFLVQDLSSKDRVIDRLQNDNSRYQSDIYKLRQNRLEASPISMLSAEGETEIEEVQIAGAESSAHYEAETEVVESHEEVGQSHQSDSDTDSDSSDPEDPRVSMHEYMAIVTELDRSRKENIRLQKELGQEGLETGDQSIAVQELKKELSLSYSTISDLRAALATAGKTVPLKKHNELRDEYVRVREALRRVQSSVTDHSVSVSEEEHNSLSRKLENSEREMQNLRTQLANTMASNASTKKELSTCQEEVFRLKSAPVATKKAAPAKKKKSAPKKKAVPKTPDDLTKIKGIGPVIQKQLNSMGITNFIQIAEFKAADIRRVGEALGTFPDRIKRDRWVQSAKKLHKEKYGA